jgi:TRAP-type C4-dicarboxylate transport system permease small subunit
MAATWRWSVRLFSVLAMLLFAALMIIFIVITVNHFGQKEYVTDNVAGLPPVYVVTAILVPFCAAFVGGFWMLFLDSFKRQAAIEQAQQQQTPLPPVPAPPSPLVSQPETFRDKVMRFIRERGRPD